MCSRRGDAAPHAEALRAEVKAASADRARVVKAAEFAFGARSPELKEFRPTTEGRTRAGS